MISFLVSYLLEKWHNYVLRLQGFLWNWLTALQGASLSMGFLSIWAWLRKSVSPLCFADPCSPGAPDQGIGLQDCRDSIQRWPSWWTGSVEWLNHISVPAGPWHPDLSLTGWAQGDYEEGCWKPVWLSNCRRQNRWAYLYWYCGTCSI